MQRSETPLATPASERTQAANGLRSVGPRPGCRLWFVVIAMAVAVFEPLVLSAPAESNAFGGWEGVRGEATGFFHVERKGEVWWWIAPDGAAFWSKGVNHVSYTADRAPKLGYAPYQRAVEARYGAVESWAAAVVARLRGWGVNTVGAWSSPETTRQQMPYAFLAGLSEGTGADWQSGRVADVFDPRFAEAVRQKALRVCAPLSKDRHLLGYFTDNELRWGPDWRSRRSLFEEFLKRDGSTPGKQALLGMLRERHPTVEAFNQAWGTRLRSFEDLSPSLELPMNTPAAEAAKRAFLRNYAGAYFKTCRDAIREADPNHLVLGCRFAGSAPEEVVEGMIGQVDVVSFNSYDPVIPKRTLDRLHQATGRPVMLTEFSFKAMDSGLPNTRGGGKPVATQADRADLFERFVTDLAKLPYLIGYHWFEHADEPAEGRFDGEHCNYGLVDIRDQPWTVLVERFQSVNARLEAMHAEGATDRR